MICNLKSIALAWIIALVCSIALAHSDGIYNPTANNVGNFEGIDSNKASGTGCSQATTFLARTSGLSGTEQTAYTNLICGLVTDGIITGNLSGAAGCGSVLDGLYILATNTTTTAALNLCGTSFSLVAHNSPTFTADVGYTGNGSNAYLDTQYAPSANGVNLTLNSASLGAYIQTATGVSNTVAVGAGTNGSNFFYLDPVTSSTYAWELNGNTFPTVSNTNPQGAWAASRTSSSATALYKNGSTTPFGSSGSDTSTARNVNTIFILALDVGGSVNNASNYQLSAVFFGGALTAVQAVAINNRINTYMTALGHNVY